MLAHAIENFKDWDLGTSSRDRTGHWDTSLKTGNSPY